jgi:hypothetical protein
MGNKEGSILAFSGAALLISCLAGAPAQAQSDRAAERAAVFDYWTPARRAAAQPRDLVIDTRGLGYLRQSDGSLQPYGHQVAAAGDPVTRGKPVDDTTPPVIGSDMDPASGATIGASHTFSVTVTDDVGLRSVDFVIEYPSGQTDTFAATNASGDLWTVSLSGFTDGSWGWHVVAADTGKRGGNETVSAQVSFTVDTNGGGNNGGGEGVVTNAEWTGGGAVQTATGRLFYEMPTNPRHKRWAGYVCSGTVISDGTTGRSIVLTASHCVYDDANKAFARNVLFIPDQAGTTGSGTDSNCSNDPLGCWVADFGVVDVNWTTRTFPDNVAWDYAYYVVEDVSGSHQGPGGDILDVEASAMSMQFTAPSADDSANDGPGAPDYTHAMGYSYSDDPNFMYCAEDMQDMDAANWWIPSCGLSGGSSGGPWFQPLNESNGTGPIISVNSWGYATSPGMAGPKLNGTSAQCLLDAARNNAFAGGAADGDAGYAVTCP